MITPGTIGRFLLGQSDAIKTVSHSTRATFLLALLFIVSAGLARNYDQHLLFEEAMWIMGPVAMALFSSLLIYGFLKVAGQVPSCFETFTNYGAFLRCFLMTAPLAWLYGIPVEEFLEALPATIFNFWVLLVVSIWRLFLMARVVQVLFGFSRFGAFALVAIPASLEMFSGTVVTRGRIVGMMGGMRLIESKQFLLSAAETMTFGSMMLFIVSISGLLIRGHGSINPWKSENAPSKVARQSWIAALLAIALWAAAAIVPQQRLQHLATLHRLIEAGRYAEASDFAEETSEDGFPPHHRLLPRPSYHAPPYGILLLAHERDWPAWLHSKLEDDVTRWLAKKASYDEATRYQILYHEVRKAPYVQEVADRLTPGIAVESLERESEAAEIPPPPGGNPKNPGGNPKNPENQGK